ncbi:MAG: HEAT repeat domain-containing protein [Acidobacteriota bacterium]|jgi:hypothetical protein
MAPDSEVPPPPAEEELLPEPTGAGRLVGSPHATAAHDSVLALTKAARSFTLYDPANKVVRKLIGEYREKTRYVLDTFGALHLVVHPFELRLGDEVVYVDQDRERSLAFRLFRDGVRSLTFETATSWEELVHLLQILSIRYTGVRQQEDDLVTLLRKAGFEHIKLAAIEGFIPEEEQAEAALAGGAQGRHTSRYDPPDQWDLPLPPLKEAAPLRYRPVSEDLLERLRAEESPETAATDALRAVLELLDLAAGTDLETVTGFALEARQFLIVERRLDLLVDLLRGARAPLAAVPGAFESFVGAFLDEDTLRALVLGLPADTAELPAPLAEVLEGAPGDVVGRMVDLLIAEGTGTRAPLLRRLVAHSCGLSTDIIAGRLHEAQGPSKVALLQLLAEVDPPAALRAAEEACRSDDGEVQLEALRMLEAVDFSPETARALRHLVESPVEQVRTAALPVMAERGGPRVTATLVAHAEKRVESLSAAEAKATGGAIARSSPRVALDTFRGWLEAKGGGLLGRLVKMPAPPILQQVALAGLERIGGPEADELLGVLAEKGEDAVAAAAKAAVRRRQSGGGERRG